MQALHRNTQLSSSQFEILSHPGARETMVDLRGVPGGPVPGYCFAGLGGVRSGRRPVRAGAGHCGPAAGMKKRSGQGQGIPGDPI